MGVGRRFNKKSRRRPCKSIGDRKRREKVHRRRLTAAGIPEENLAHMNCGEMRAGLRRIARKVS